MHFAFANYNKRYDSFVNQHLSRAIFRKYLSELLRNGFRDVPLFLFYKLLSTMSEISYYTEEGLKKLKDELNYLKTTARPDISKQIAEARDKGDLSENAEYDAAKEAQGLLELKIAKLGVVVGNARVMDEKNIDTSKVSVLSKIKIKNKKNGATMTYTLVSEEEADLKTGKISVQSPIGKGLLGKKVGDTTEIQVPAGKVEFEVLEISI